MSHSSDTDQPARRRTTAAVLIVVLLAVVAGVLSMAPTTGSASACVDRPTDTVVAAPDEAARPAQVRAGPRSMRRVIAAPGAADRPAGPISAGLTPLGRAASPLTTVADDPPPGRSPPAR